MGEVIFCHALLDPIDFCFFPSLASSTIYSLLCHASVGKWYVICWVVFCCFLVRELGSPRAVAQVPKFLPFLGKLCCLGKLLVSKGMLTCGVKPPGCLFSSWYWEEHVLSFYPLYLLYSPSSPSRGVTCLPWSLQACVKWRPSDHQVCLLIVSSWAVFSAGPGCFWSHCDFHCYTSVWCEMEGAARFGLSCSFVVMDVDCGKCEGKSHILGAGWENMEMSPGSRGTGHSAQNSTQGMRKCFLPREFPSFSADLCVPLSGQPLLS